MHKFCFKLYKEVSFRQKVLMSSWYKNSIFMMKLYSFLVTTRHPFIQGHTPIICGKCKFNENKIEITQLTLWLIHTRTNLEFVLRCLEVASNPVFSLFWLWLPCYSFLMVMMDLNQLLPSLNHCFKEYLCLSNSYVINHILQYWWIFVCL